MGTFLEAEDLKQRTDSALLKGMEVDDIDDRFIVPAERAIEVAFALNLDTDNIPWHQRSVFSNRADLRTRFEGDYRRAVIALVNFWANNQHYYSSQSVGDASVEYTNVWPDIVGILMNPWTSGGGGDRTGTIRRG